MTSSPEKADQNKHTANKQNHDANSNATSDSSANQAKQNPKQNQKSKQQAPQTSASQNSPASLRKALNECMMRDRFRLSKRISGASRIKNEQSKHAVFDEIALDIAKSMMTATQRAAQKPTIEYPEILPVSQKRDDIAKAIAENQVVIVAGEKGSGKKTPLPKICF